jgi:hypothetical protein
VFFALSKLFAFFMQPSNLIVLLHAPGPDQERFIRLYAEHVLPRLRRRFGAPEVA